MFKKLTAFLCGLFWLAGASSQALGVTSNADSGPGTLRAAIILANSNGSSTLDSIYFNIPDVTIQGRTIALVNDLPDLSSNIIIDGSTQPGSKIGVSDAKIRITTATGGGITHVFKIVGHSNLAFYGLHIDNIKAPNISSPAPTFIGIRQCNNIRIGDIGRGNYFTRVPTVVTDLLYGVPPGRGINTGLYIRNNVLNLSEDGNSIVSHGYMFTLNNIRDLEIGGELPQQGNYMVTAAEHIGWTYTDTMVHMNTGTYKIMNNKLGSNYAGTAGLKCGSIYLRNGNSYGYTDTTNVIVKNNRYDASSIVGSNWLQGFLSIQNKKGFIDIKGNRIGLLNSGSTFFNSSISTPIGIGGCDDGIIGGDNPADSNVIAGCNGSAISLGNNKAIKVTKNSIFCTSNGISAVSTRITIPYTKIFTITTHLVAGTTLPNSKVEVFLTKTCTGCNNGKEYLGYTMADGSGNWSFTSPVVLDGAVTATGTSPQNATGAFAKPEYRFEPTFAYQPPTCKQNNGYIKGIRFVAGTRFYWVRTNLGVRDTITTEDVLNAAPGFYKFVVEQGPYCSVEYQVGLFDNSPKIGNNAPTISHPTCGKANGKIMNHYLSGSYNKIVWKDLGGNVVGTAADLQNVPAGQYKLIILDTTFGCGDSTQYYTLTNQSGPAINTSNVQVNAATCGSNNGSITGITATNATGVQFVQWVDSVNMHVGYSFNLVNVHPGKYRFKFKDGSGCDTIITAFYIVPNNGQIELDTAGKVIKPSKCSGSTGSISNLKVTGATNYQWKNTVTNIVVGNAINVQNLAEGFYQLTASNSLGCNKLSPVLLVPQANFIPIGVTSVSLRDAYCGQNNGFVKVNSFNADSNFYSFKWKDSATGQLAAIGTAIYNTGGGTYFFFATDSNGCESKIMTSTIKAHPIHSLNEASISIKDDNCNQLNGSVTGLQVQGNVGTVSFAWLNSANTVIGSAIDLHNVGAGTYVLRITDAGVCTIQSRPFVVGNKAAAIEQPKYNDMVVPRNADVQLVLLNPATGSYRLYSDPAGLNMLQQNQSGSFTVQKIASDTSFFMRRAIGTCVSTLTQVRIKVVDRSYFEIPNAFTPNADGINDRFRIKYSGQIQLKYFRVFNRWGQLVFETNNASKGWDGNILGRPASTGAYVWVAEGKDISGNLIVDKGTVILIR